MIISGILAAVMLSAPINAKVEQLSWFSGRWHCSSMGGTFEEHWMPVKGGTTQGTGRLLIKGKVEFMEFMSIEPEGKGVTMWMVLDAPSKGEKKPMPFRLTGLKGKEATFENPANDFPSKIVYRMRANGNLWCRISGKQGGKAAAEDFDFRKG